MSMIKRWIAGLFFGGIVFYLSLHLLERHLAGYDRISTDLWNDGWATMDLLSGHSRFLRNEESEFILGLFEKHGVEPKPATGSSIGWSFECEAGSALVRSGGQMCYVEWTGDELASAGIVKHVDDPAMKRLRDLHRSRECL